MDGFQCLSRSDVERQLGELLSRWDSASEERESFKAWAWLVATASDTFANENRDACAELLRAETEALERIIRVRARHVQGVSEELEKKRAFLAYLKTRVALAEAMSAEATGRSPPTA